jgi:hypothetical protein
VKCLRGDKLFFKSIFVVNLSCSLTSTVPCFRYGSEGRQLCYSCTVLVELVERDVRFILGYRPSSHEEFLLAPIHPPSGRLLWSFTIDLIIVRNLHHQCRDLQQSTYLYLSKDQDSTTHQSPKIIALILMI